MAFFDFYQNNSGGSFTFNEQAGISHYVIIEADDYKEANERAEEIGLYFDGYGDCVCCGSRWGEQSSYDEGSSVPSIYDSPVFDGPPLRGRKWIADGPEGYVHYKDGTVKEFDDFTGEW